MSRMCNSTRQESGLGLIKNIPKTILNKFNISANITEEKISALEVIIISEDNVDNLRKFVDNFGGKYEDLGYSFGIVTLSVDNLVDLASNEKIQYIEMPKSLYTSDLRSNKAACVPIARTAFDIQGQGVLIGFIDSGIDYTHPGFINRDGTTRIEYIYDLSEGGKVYDKNMINEALKAADPFSKVPSYDSTEHGTHVAGIACAGGTINPNYYGVAPQSSIVMVKCTRGKYTLSTNILRGLKFLVDKSKELNMPLSINVSLSTNDGAHNGTSLLEQYIHTVSLLEKTTIVIAAGNEGEASHHIGGQLKGETKVSFNVAGDENSVIINLYKSILPEIEIKIVSSRGLTSGYVQIKEGYIEGNIGRDRYQILTTGPKPFDINGDIVITLNSNAQYISPGQWDIFINVINKYEGSFDMWLPISEGLNMKTKFLQPAVQNTLGIPATVSNVISVGSYNSVTNNISSFSGRGRLDDSSVIKPDMVAPGEGITSVIPNNSFDVKSGTSMATPHVAGIAALLMEWGIVKGNDLYLYGERLKYYLIKGCKRQRVDISYPDVSWGYGEVCLLDALDIIVNTLGVSFLKENDKIMVYKDYLENYSEYMIGNLFIRRPIDL